MPQADLTAGNPDGIGTAGGERDLLPVRMLNEFAYCPRLFHFMHVEGRWADGVTGLRGMRVEIAMMRTPDGHSRLEMSRFLAPPVAADHRRAPVNALGYLRVMFTVEDIDDTLARLRKCGAELVGDVVQYEDMYRLCYIRGPEGILIGLAQQLERQTSRADPLSRER